MQTNELVKSEEQKAIELGAVEKAMVQGDLASLNEAERLNYYQAICGSLGLNPMTKPFDYIKLNGRLVLYAKRDATDQLRKIHNVSVAFVGRERLEDVYIVTARATLPNGRGDESTGVVSIQGLRGDALANALMKAETKAKRRVTLSIVGLGFLDETEIETIPSNVVDIPAVTRQLNNDDDGQAAPARQQEQHWGNEQSGNWFDRNPPFDRFMAEATKAFSLTDSDVKDELKAAGFQGYKPTQAAVMWTALEHAAERAAGLNLETPADTITGK